MIPAVATANTISRRNPTVQIDTQFPRPPRSSLGYKRHFAELPSETLRRARMLHS